MSFNGKLGSSLLGDFELGFEGGNPLEQSVESIIVFVSTVASGTEFLEDVESEITFVSDATFNIERNVFAASTLAFTQDATNNIRQESVTSTLVFISEAEDRASFKEAISQFMLLEQVAVGHVGVRHVGVGNFISFVQKVGRAFQTSVTTTITFVSEGARKNIGISTLAFVSTATAAKGSEIESEIEFVHEAIANGEYTREAENEIEFNQAVAYYLLSDCVKKEYNPFIGASTEHLFPVPSAVAPTLAAATLTLTYPYVTPTSTLELRNPDFSNRDRLNFNRINRATRGGSLIVYADSIWPKMQSLQVTVSWLKGQQLSDLRTFLLDSLGQEIGFLDNENRQWRGFITNPDLNLTHAQKHDRQIILEFEGELA